MKKTSIGVTTMKLSEVIDRKIWKWSNPKRATHVTVRFNLITDSGHEIANVCHQSVAIPEKLQRRISTDGDTIFGFYKYLRFLELEKEMQSILNPIATKILKNAQGRKLKKMKVGLFYSGKYIVKVVWDIEDIVKYEEIKYEDKDKFPRHKD